MLNNVSVYDLTSINCLKNYTDNLQNEYNKNNSKQYILALILYKESKGLSLEIKELFACTFSNRIKNSEKELSAAEIYKMFQNKIYYPNCEKQIKGINITDKEFAICSRLSGLSLRNGIKDRTYGATFFHHEDDNPAICLASIPTIQLGKYIFYKL